jgi:hypothetical protein
MILNKKQIAELKREHLKAEKAERKLSFARQGIAMLIQDFTGIEGECDLLQGDGFGFTPNSNNDTHIPIDDLIKHAETGQDITEEFILRNLSI